MMKGISENYKLYFVFSMYKVVVFGGMGIELRDFLLLFLVWNFFKVIC